MFLHIGWLVMLPQSAASLALLDAQVEDQTVLTCCSFSAGMRLSIRRGWPIRRGACSSSPMGTSSSVISSATSSPYSQDDAGRFDGTNDARNGLPRGRGRGDHASSTVRCCTPERKEPVEPPVR